MSANSAAKQSAADELKRQFPLLSLSEAYSVLERHSFDVSAAAMELRGIFVASAGDHGVMYEMPKTDGDAKSTMEKLFRAGGGGAAAAAAAAAGAEGHAFFGPGRRLGHTEMPSPVIAAAVRQQRTVTVAVYANEIRVAGDGEGAPSTVIPMNTPEANVFMEEMQAGVVPHALSALFPGCDLNVELQDRLDREYEAPAQRFTAFQDEGRRLGTSAAATSAELSYNPQHTFSLDEAADTTVVRVVNTKGAQTELKVNPKTHTVEDLYFLAHQLEPERRQFFLEVRDMPPRKLGPETRRQTIEEAKLKRAVVVMRT